MKFLLNFIILLFLSHSLFATHYRAGEISFVNLRDANGNPTLTYKIFVTTYTKFNGPDAPLADRCQLVLRIGTNGDTILMNRINGAPATIGGSCAGKPAGVTLNSNEFKMNVYEIDTPYTFVAGGAYRLFVTDKNRVAGVSNIPNSVDEPFTLEALLDLTFSNFNDNSSPVFTNPPLDKACNFKCFYHNPGAVDPDGDSLAYFIDTCRGVNLIKIPGYILPNNISILSDGTFSWCTPTNSGIYNYAIRVEEYRKRNGKYVRIGYIIRDFQVDVGNCLNNPPSIMVTDTCVAAGTKIIKKVKATDSENNFIRMRASGTPFKFNPSATFTTTVSVSGSATSEFVWQTKCDQVRREPYTIVVRAIDDSNPDSLTRYESFNIQIIGTAIRNLAATTQGSKVRLTWDKPLCAIAKSNSNSNGITGYNIYRKLGCDSFKFDPCSRSIDPTSNYTLVGKTNSVNILNFVDDDNGVGLKFNQSYSYFVVPIYFDGAASSISKQVCVILARNVPSLINVDVTKTGTTNGEIFVRWLRPLTGGNGNLDTLLFPGPYKFQLIRFDASVANDLGTIVKTVSQPFFKSIKNLSDTTFTDLGIDTKNKQFKYRVDFFATPSNVPIGNSNEATSTYLTLRGNNKKLILNWKFNVPWDNYQYFVYQEVAPNSFTLLDTTNQTSDTIFNLVNGSNYCYRVVCKGRYNDILITYDSLINASQTACGMPNDLEAPCNLNVKLLADCEASTLSIGYSFENGDCDTLDVLKFKLWRSATDTGKFVVLDSVFGNSIRQILYVNKESLAGCYAVTAVDSTLNEHAIKNKICIENCDYKFELPNIFTPNTDATNDLFTPINKDVRFVNKLDFKIFDRWGLLVYETNDILINWDGVNQKSKQKCSDGVYFYIGNATIGRLKGNEVKKLTGFIHLQRGN